MVKEREEAPRVLSIKRVRENPGLLERWSMYSYEERLQTVKPYLQRQTAQLSFDGGDHITMQWQPPRLSPRPYRRPFWLGAGWDGNINRV